MSAPLCAPPGGWGGDGSPGRALTAVGWSGQQTFPGVVAPNGAPMPLGAFSSPDGSPHLWSVSVGIVEPNDGAPYEDFASFVRAEYSIGRLQNRVDFDLVRGWSSFSMYADQIKLFVRNATAAERVVQYACTPAWGYQGVGYPTRTVRIGALVNPTDVLIPRAARDVQVIGAVAGGIVNVEFLDGAGGSAGAYDYNQAPTTLSVIPGGSRTLRLTAAAPGFPVTAIFRLGF